MHQIYYIDRLTKEKKEEKVYGEKALRLFYGNTWISKSMAKLFFPLLPLFSKIYGWIQKKSFTKRKVKSFIYKYELDEKEFETTHFSSFNDFFVRKLKPSTRPIDTREKIVIMPADARYLVYPNFYEADGFFVKGKKFTLREFLQDEALAKKYQNGAMAIIRLCPVDYHRFHFPVDCMPTKPRLINGALHSVNPIALCKNITYLSENKRMITELNTELFKKILFIEIGATNVGSIYQTFQPEQTQVKGAEKGYFSFGGSCIVLLFEPNILTFDQDLLDASDQKIEVLGKMGQSLGYVS